jgi:hypothetical protein
MSQERCDVCNSRLFVAEPFKTTQQEIKEVTGWSEYPSE